MFQIRDGSRVNDPTKTLTWPDSYLTRQLPQHRKEINSKKIERGSCQRKEIGIIACKKCMLKTTKLHWGHFEHDCWVSLNRNSNSENIIIMRNQIAPGIFEFPCNPLPRNVILSFLWWNRCESVLPVRDGKLMRCMFGQRSTVLAFPNKMASKRWPCGAESTVKMIF